jgi:hypothetical protein
VLGERRFERERGDERLTPGDRQDRLAFRRREVGPGGGELLPERLPFRFSGGARFRRRCLRGAFALESAMRAAEPGDLPCLRRIGMMGESRFAADGAGLPAEVSTLEEHRDGGAGLAEGACLGGEGARLLGGFGARAVGVAPGALVAAFAVGAPSSGGAVAVGTGARDDGGGHGGAIVLWTVVILWDGVTVFVPRKPGVLHVRESSFADTHRPPHQPPRTQPERHRRTAETADLRGMPQHSDRGVPGVHLYLLPKRSARCPSSGQTALRRSPRRTLLWFLDQPLLWILTSERGSPA